MRFRDAARRYLVNSGYGTARNPPTRFGLNLTISEILKEKTHRAEWAVQHRSGRSPSYLQTVYIERYRYIIEPRPISLFDMLADQEPGIIAMIRNGDAGTVRINPCIW